MLWHQGSSIPKGVWLLPIVLCQIDGLGLGGSALESSPVAPINDFDRDRNPKSTAQFVAGKGLFYWPGSVNLASADYQGVGEPGRNLF